MNTEYELEVRHTPYGVSDVVETRTFAAGNGLASILLRTNLLANSPNTAHQELEFRIKARHDYNGETQIESRNTLTHRVTPTSTLSGQVAMGQATWSNPLPTSYTAAATGTYTINIGAAFTTGNVQYRLNGGSWTTSFAAGLTTGTIPGVTATDTIELRHDANDGAQQNFVELQNPSATAVAYGLLTS